jgi:hypothetical protein
MCCTYLNVIVRQLLNIWLVSELVGRKLLRDAAEAWGHFGNLEEMLLETVTRNLVRDITDGKNYCLR